MCRLLSTFLSAALLSLISNADLQSQLQKFKTGQPTVCTITINSIEEKIVFQEALPNFNFIELIDEENNERWLQRACQANIQCDVLLISGHFAGSFFGQSKHTLDISELEEASCNSKCDGILKRPTEKFLMGCNTLAGKNSDNRTTQEYIQILTNDGFSLLQAQQIAAFRYSPIGSSYAARMQYIFSGETKKIYGFNSVGPSGKNIKSSLEKYFSEVPNYKKHLTLMNSITSKNITLQKHLKKFSFAESAGFPFNKKNPVCILSDNQSHKNKLNWINEIISDKEKAFAYLPHFLSYFKKYKAFLSAAPPVEVKKELEKLKSNQLAKKDFLQFLDQPNPGLTVPQIQVIQFANEIGWFSEKLTNTTLKKILKPIFKQSIQKQERDFLCNIGIQVPFELSDLPPPGVWTTEFVETLSCLRGLSKETALVILNQVKNKELVKKWDRIRVLQAITKVHTSGDRDINSQFITLLEDADPNVRWEMFSNLTTNDLASNKTDLMKILMGKNKESKKYAITLLTNLRPKEVEVHKEVARHLADPYLRQKALEFFKQVKTQEPSIISEIQKWSKSK